MEDVRPVPGFSKYSVTRNGDVYRGAFRLRPVIRDGYATVVIRDNSGRARNGRIHVLVLEAYVGPRPPGYVGHHINHVRDDNRLENLQWVTQSENMRAAWEFHQRVAENKKKLDVELAAWLLSAGATRKEIQLVLGCAKSTLGTLFRGTHWQSAEFQAFRKEYERGVPSS